MINKPSIAGVVLALNEELDIGRALRSLGWCDELIVVDSGSTDQTIQVALSYGAKVLTNIQNGPFLITEQRNWVLENPEVKSEWIFFLDADEVVGPELAAYVKTNTIINTSHDAYELTPRFWFFGKWLKYTQGYPNWHPRLVKKHTVRFEGGVWESFSSHANIGRIDIPYEHYAFSKGLEAWTIRHLRYAKWDAMEILQSQQAHHLPNPIRTKRFSLARNLLKRVWPLRPLLRFMQKYLLQLGCLDGWQGLLYSLLIATFDLYVVILVLQHKFLLNEEHL